MNRYERVCANINLDAIAANITAMKNNINKNTGIIAVIKTDAYGHGAVAIALQLEQMEAVIGYATATFEEAMILRKAGVKKDIMILGYTFPSCYEEMIHNDIQPAVFREDMLEELDRCAKEMGKVCRIQIKVDTGMSRIGIMPDALGEAFVKKAFQMEHIVVEGIFTHFARADERDKSATISQFQTFMNFTNKVQTKNNVRVPLIHCANSAGIVEMKEANLNAVRAGITLYGLWPSDEVSRDIIKIFPVLSLKSHITFIKNVEKGVPVSYGATYVTGRKTMIATIPIGYGDGYPRSLSNKAQVLIRGQRANIIGRICMDQFMVDVTDIKDVREGDSVTLIGTDGKEEITMEELGEKSGRFNYELACDLSKRIPRVYYKNGKEVYAKDYFEDSSIEKI